MKAVFLVLFLSVSSLFAQKVSFASQSDLIADLSDAVLDGIYHHRLCQPRCCYERSVWLEGFGNFRHRNFSDDYKDWFGGIIGGFNFALSCDSYLNFFVGGSLGEIDIDHESNFDTNSVFFGMTWEQLCGNSFYGFTIAGGYLEEERNYSVHEEPRGVLFIPELTYAYQFDCMCIYPIFTSSLRYAGFFSHDYQHRETLGTLYVKKRSIQLFTLRGEFALPLCYGIEPYAGVGGRFQFDGNHIKGRLLQSTERFSDGIDNVIGYGLLGIRASRRCSCVDMQANAEWSYDSDSSWRILGELSLNYSY